MAIRFSPITRPSMNFASPADRQPMRARRKRGESGKGHVDPFYQRRERFNQTLGALGMKEAFCALPRAMQEALLCAKFPDPVVELDQSVPQTDEYRTLFK